MQLFANPINTPAVRLLAAVEPDPDGTALAPEEVTAGSRHKRQIRAAQRSVKIEAADSHEKLLLEEPLLHPLKRCVVVLDSKHHGGLVFDTRPELLRQSAQIRHDATDQHEEQTAGGNLVVTTQDESNEVHHHDDRF